MKRFLRFFVSLLLVAVLVIVGAAVIQNLLPGFEWNREQEYEYERSDRKSSSFDGLVLSEPGTKNSGDLVSFALHAWESGWGYVWGTFGDVLDETTLSDRAERYPSVIEPKMDFIRENWLGYRAADCSGLIKAYWWYEPGIGINYGANGFSDCDANTMFSRAQESGAIDSIPEIPGLGVWCDGHIGVYIGDGVVVEAMATDYGVVKTRLEGHTGSRWTHWLKLEGISYP